MIRSFLLLIHFGKAKAGKQPNLPATGQAGRDMQQSAAPKQEAQGHEAAKPAPAPAPHHETAKPAPQPSHYEAPQQPHLNFHHFKSAVKNVFTNNSVQYGTRTPTQQEHDRVAQYYKTVSGKVAPYKAAAPKPTAGERFKATISNIKNVATSAIDNTVGLGIAKYQNYKTKDYFRNSKDQKDNIVYLMHGVFQNQGSQWRLAKELKKQGYRPYHLHGNHIKGRKYSVDKAYEQIESFHKAANIRDAKERQDYFSGHSSGADTGIHMSGDSRIKKYGIASVQARAPGPYGLKATTIGQRMLLPFVSGDDITSFMGQKEAVDTYKVNPQVPVYVVAGYNDGLVTPSDAVYDKAQMHYLVTGPESTHFGTSGVNKKSNKQFVDLIKAGHNHVP